MKQKLIVAGLALTMLLSGATAALAGPDQGPGAKDNGHNSKGQCTAFFNGQKNGHSPNELEAVADYYDYCMGLDGPGNSAPIGGQGAGEGTNGRYVCTRSDDETTCVNA